MTLCIGRAAHEAFGDELRRSGYEVRPHPHLKDVWTVR